MLKQRIAVMMRAPLAALFCFALAGAASADSQNFERIERGRYLTTLGDCGACHTKPGAEPFAGGLALQTPFGVLVAPNITPDEETGIGKMTDAEFLAALHEGRGQGGKRLYPAMPYPAFTKMSDDDVLAIRAYLATVAPVHNAVNVNQLPFPLNIRLAMVFWNALNFTPGRFQPDPQKSEQWNRGAYIVEAQEHCGTCHTPKTILGGDKNEQWLAGGTLQGWFAPDITNNSRKGIGRWSKDDVIQYLKTGTNNWTLASGPMAEAVTHSTSRLMDDDIAAIATYLKDNTAGAAPSSAPLAADDKAMRAGAAIYKDNCAACHRDAGTGDAQLFPHLAGSALVQSDDPTTLVRVVVQGTRAASTPNTPTAPAMPAFGWKFNDGQIAAVLTYIRNSWGNAASAVSAADVADRKATLAKLR
jgi:mono/diheme cytochrome c family protein